MVEGRQSRGEERIRLCAFQRGYKFLVYRRTGEFGGKRRTNLCALYGKRSLRVINKKISAFHRGMIYAFWGRNELYVVIKINLHQWER